MLLSGRSALKCVACMMVLAVLAVSCGEKKEAESSTMVTLRSQLDPVGLGGGLSRRLAADYMASRLEIRVELVQETVTTSERLARTRQYLGAQSAEVDIYMVDVVWPGLLAEHFVDLSDVIAEDRGEFFGAIVENNTVSGRLIAVPWFADAGMLYYRKDLLAKHGFAAPPMTWDELESMSRTIQQGERAAGNVEFWGYVFDAEPREGLTCVALEWIASHGGGRILEPDGTVSINSPGAIAGLERARRWIGDFVPPEVNSWAVEDARKHFQAGNSAFFRGWSYAWAVLNDESSPQRGRVGVTTMPAGPAGPATTLGGWQLAVSKYSRHPGAAKDFVRYLASAEGQSLRAELGGYLPTRERLYQSPELLEENPHFAVMADVLQSATARPSTVAGAAYNEISTIVFTGVHEMLEGKRSAEETAAELDRQIRATMARRDRLER